MTADNKVKHPQPLANRLRFSEPSQDAESRSTTERIVTERILELLTIEEVSKIATTPEGRRNLALAWRKRKQQRSN